MFLKRSRFPAQALAAIFFISLAAVAAALVAQHQFGVKPCPWCVMQRGVFLLIGLVAGLGWLLRRHRSIRRAGLILIAGLGVAGVAAAAFQHEVAAKLASCDMTFADRLLSALDLETLLPSVFMVTASCSEAAAYRLLGLPYEVWSGLLFAAIGVASLIAVKKR
ncbi:disulfide bond formation protein B [Roseateles oligotrophus]|uniref:Disulfide bond formation protein B n=1 Tax=Roseateles oligotrophus TaxID=1769250 RepID=A0ABT2YGI6_9BURK|nr:disulfide bond formation protein B [Roseateles oligotrophus]MCV2369159.1 disulfide bond formation protein B [Roseateles oligotrophus]